MIAGVGPGLGASLSRRFAKEYKVILLARSKGTLDKVSADINKNGGDVMVHLYLNLISSPLGSPPTVLTRQV